MACEDYGTPVPAEGVNQGFKFFGKRISPGNEKAAFRITEMALHIYDEQGHLVLLDLEVFTHFLPARMKIWIMNRSG